MQAQLDRLLAGVCLAVASGLLGTGATPLLHAGDVGFTDTPFLPGQKWRVHDATRPRPPVVTPGARFSELAPPPSDAIVLFDGTDLSQWVGEDGPARWKVENGYMEVNNTGSIRTRRTFGDFQLHLEWATPSHVDPSETSQKRGNSGVLIFGRFEVQVLDSYHNITYADGQAGALYGQWPPLVNACRKPGAWQTYDIIFEAPRWQGHKLVKPAMVTVIHNGVVLHHKQAFIGEVRHKEVAHYGRPISRGPIMLQDHHNPVRYRNIWIRPLGEYDRGARKR